MAIKPVKHLHSAMTGAPVLSGVAGTLIAVLDACLVNGFNLITLDSLVVSGEVLTGTKAGHGYVVDQIVETAASEPALNGQWVVTSVTSNTFICDATGVANVTGTGTKTAKTASAGWSKIFSGTNKAVYKSNDVQHNGQVLRVDDSAATFAKVVGYESMTDVDTGVGPFPTVALAATGGWWGRANAANASARRWDIFADSLAFFYSVQPYIGQETFDTLYFFGQFPSEKQGDAYNTYLTAHPADYTNSGGYPNVCQISGGYPTMPGYMPRSYTQLGSAILAACSSFAIYASGVTYSGESATGNSAYPSLITGGLIFGKPVISESYSSSPKLRCAGVPGLFVSPQSLTSAFAHRDTVNNSNVAPGRKLKIISCGASGSYAGRAFIDITGPWR